MRSHRLIVVALALGFLAFPIRVSAGGTEQEGSVNVEQAELTALVNIHGGGRSGGGGGGGSSGCTYHLLDPGTAIMAETDGYTWPRVDAGGRTYHLYHRVCPSVGRSGLVEIAEGAGVADLLPLAIQQLRSGMVPQPVVEFQALDSEFGWAYVTVPVDFRVTNAAPVSVTAEVGAPFNVWVTVTAAPSRIVFDPGEAGSGGVACSAAGAAAAYVPERPGECSYTYVNSSSTAADGRSFSTTVTVEWDVTYASSSGPGSLAGLSTSASAALQVAEIQALVTCTGPRPEQGGCG